MTDPAAASSRLGTDADPVEEKLATLRRERDEATARAETMTKAGNDFAAGHVSSGKLAEVLGVTDTHDFKMHAGAFEEKWDLLTREQEKVGTLTTALAEREAEVARLLDVLRQCEEYFDDRADASTDTGALEGNREMDMLVMVRAAREVKP